MITMKVVTKLTYLLLLAALVLVPLFVWALLSLDGDASTNADMSGLGAFAAGVGVPMGVLTAAMAAVKIGKSRGKTWDEA